VSTNLVECPFSPATRAAILLPFYLYEQYDEVVSTSGCKESGRLPLRLGMKNWSEYHIETRPCLPSV